MGFEFHCSDYTMVSVVCQGGRIVTLYAFAVAVAV